MAGLGLLRLGKLVRDRRKGRGIREVATEIGISAATLSRVERGKLPDLGTFSKICGWLGVDPAEMLGVSAQRPGRKKSGQGSEEIVISAHFRAPSTIDPKVARDLAELILAAQRTMTQ